MTLKFEINVEVTIWSILSPIAESNTRTRGGSDFHLCNVICGSHDMRLLHFDTLTTVGQAARSDVRFSILGRCMFYTEYIVTLRRVATNYLTDDYFHGHVINLIGSTEASRMKRNGEKERNTETLHAHRWSYEFC